ncbi:helix-turn-helix domain-containing protein [Neisseria sp. ZJ106]|uniref:Helix-turn-helix domain-containing protein n=1 Tax=Neisseria lisongii TaxID=2912188 RepID=A0ABY7RKI2_9NEIS|nr:helix-turn-helix domain-containing protein [Neisseria lisongii]MCF7520452.1 helix-turn-helix domain-containing protein [Neisseria lisongii]WCL71605.1 helix-turn-helix domain-containing protein [Neisseria lisongii]
MKQAEQALSKAFANIDIDAVTAAVIADDPEAVVIINSLKEALQCAKDGIIGRITEINISPAAQTRNKTGLSQAKFAAALNISPATLRAWEQGRRMPSGAAATLLKLIDKRPELLNEL